MGNVEVLGQLVNSMADAVEKLGSAAQENQVEDFNKIKVFILDLQKRIKIEVAK